MSSAYLIEALIRHHSADCSKLIFGRCSTRRCMVRGGWKAGDSVMFDASTCEALETVNALTAANAEIERLRERAGQMAIREIPKAYEYQCDRCNAVHRQENAIGQYSDSRPPSWSRLELVQDAHDYYGVAVASGTRNLLLCHLCTKAANRMVDQFIVDRNDD